MNRVALHIARGQFDRRVKIKARDVRNLGEAINYMAQELDGKDQMRKDFVANVPHDLRSPSTSIHGFVRTFLDYKIMKEETERMIKLNSPLPIVLSK